jgi:GntR family transcriptional regulator, arabinose operon transcriptional repressor
MKCLEQIDGLRQAIKAGQVAPGDMIGTEFAFSQQWGLTRSTVRRGIEQLVDEGLLERRPGKGLFVPAPQAVTGRTVQLVAPNLSWAYMTKIMRGAQIAGRKVGIQLQVCDAHGEMDADLEVLRRLPDGHADGAIIVSLHHRRFSEVLFELKSVGYPFVLVDQRLQDLDVPTVEEDNYGGGYLVGKKFAEMGHSRIAFLGPMKIRIVADRLQGFRDALADAGVVYDRSLITDLGGEGLTDWLNERVEATEDALIPLLTGPNRPTAIFDGSGDLAAFVYRVARKLDLKIPSDLSVITFDDSLAVNFFLEPPVAQLSHSWGQVGTTAFEILHKQMGRSRRATDESLTHEVMTVEWVPGSSLAAPYCNGAVVH